MEVVLGISMTPTTVRMVLVEGDKADGLMVECDQFCPRAAAEAVTASAAEQVGAAVLATQQNASRQGHTISACGIAVSEDCDADAVRKSVAARGLGDVVIVGEPQAATALTHTVARAVGYTRTALLFVKERAATLSVVDSVHRSVVEELTRSLQSADVSYVLKEMLADFTVERTQGLFVVDSSGRLEIVRECLEAATSLPIIFPEEHEWALARGAALSAAAAPRFEASTSSLAYAKDPDVEQLADSTGDATVPLAPAEEVTRGALLDVIRLGSMGSLHGGDGAPSLARRFVPVGSVAASAVVIGVVAVVMALAVSATPTSTEHLVERGQTLPTEPNAAAPPAPPAVYNAAPAPNPVPLQVAPPPPPAVTAQPAPRTIAVQAPAPAPQMVQPVAAAQAPVKPKPVVAAAAEPAPEPAPDPVDPPSEAAPVPLAAPAPQIPAWTPPAPALQLPQITLAPPVSQPPAAAPQAPFLRWLPAFLRPQQLAPQWQPPVQQYTPPVQQYTPPVQQYTPPVQQYTPPVQQYTPPVQQYTPPVQQAPSWPQSPSFSGGFDGGSRYFGGGAPFWPIG